MRVTDFTSTPADAIAIRARERSIGAVLIDSGRLSPGDAEKVLALQKETGLRFGQAAVELGLLTQADIDYALSRQFDYPCLRGGESKVSEELVTAHEPAHKQVEQLRALRSQLMLRWLDQDPGRRAIAILSGGRKEGRSYVAANLAVLFSQLGQRTLLIDADLRRPRQHELFGLDDRVGLSAMLSGRAGPEAIQRIPLLLDLSVLPAGVTPPNPQDLLARPQFASLLADLAGHYDVILLDTPPASESADAQIIAVRAGAGVVVVRKNASRTWRVRGVADSVAQAKATIIGAVLNDF